MSSRLAGLVLVAVLPISAVAQAVPGYPGDSITVRARPAHPVYVSPGPIAPTLPGDTLLGEPLSYKAAVPLYPVAPTMPGDVITQPPQWVLDTLRADSIRQGLIVEPDSLRIEPQRSTPQSVPEQPRRKRRDDGVRKS